MAYWLYQGNEGERSDVESGIPYDSLSEAMAALSKSFATIWLLDTNVRPAEGLRVSYRDVWYYTPACGWYFWDTDFIMGHEFLNFWNCHNPLVSFYPKE